MILATLLPVAAAVFALACMLAAWRLLKGPAGVDRLLALDTLYINALALLVIVGIWQGQKLGFEVALLIALLGFIGTVVVARFIERGDIVG